MGLIYGGMHIRPCAWGDSLAVSSFRADVRTSYQRLYRNRCVCAPQTGPSEPDVNSRIRDIIGYLYDDTISEDEALAQMTAVTQKLVQQPSLAAAGTSRGCSPLPVPRLAADQMSGGGGKVDAATDPQTARPRLMADVATETPAEMSYIGTPRDMSAAPSQGPASPRRLAASAVPMLDLAALVAQAMEEAPLSGRSTASTSATASGAPSFASLSSFVLAQPEKLQVCVAAHTAIVHLLSTLESLCAHAP
jgi:hypothetical protein